MEIVNELEGGIRQTKREIGLDLAKWMGCTRWDEVKSLQQTSQDVFPRRWGESEEAFVPLTYDLLYRPIVNTMHHRAISSPQAYADEITAHLRRHFLVWARLDQFTVHNVLQEMEDLGVTMDLDSRDGVNARRTKVGVRNVAPLRWELVFSPELAA